MQILNTESFNEKLKNVKGVMMVDFFATWCGPCRMLAPILEEVSQESTAEIYKVDIDESEDLARSYGIMAVPTMIVFVDGKEVERFSGYMPKSQILSKLDAYKEVQDKKNKKELTVSILFIFIFFNLHSKISIANKII